MQRSEYLLYAQDVRLVFASTWPYTEMCPEFCIMRLRAIRRVNREWYGLGWYLIIPGNRGNSRGKKLNQLTWESDFVLCAGAPIAGRYPGSGGS